MADNYSIKLDTLSIDHGSCLINNGQMGGPQAGQTDDAILRELRGISARLAKTEPMIADTVSRLESAIKAQDKPTAAKLTQQLSTGFAASLLSNLASAGLKIFLGIP